MNDPPFFDPIADQNLRILQTLRLQITGIVGGPGGEGGESVTLTATSDNPALGVLHIKGSGRTRTLFFQPHFFFFFGPARAVITVLADDGQPVNHVFTRQFTITVHR